MSFFIDARSVRFFDVAQGRNKGTILVFGAFPLRILKHRGWSTEIYRRAMRDDEIALVTQCRRLVSYRYEDLSSLLIDELNVLGVGDAFDSESRILCSFYNTSIEAITAEWSEE